MSSTVSPENVTFVPVVSLERLRVEFPGTVTSLMVIAVHDAMADAMSVYAVTVQASEAVAEAVLVGVALLSTANAEAVGASSSHRGRESTICI